MLGKHVKAFRAPLAACLAAAFAAWGPSADARVTRIVIDTTTDLANPAVPGNLYQLVTGRAFGELDPNDPHNAIITDIQLVPRNANHNVEYIASFRIRKPKDMSTASGVMWHDVPNRGGDVALPTDSFAGGDVQLLSGWQGDNAGGTVVPANVGCLPPCAPAFANHYVKVPVLVGVTGQILGRIVNRSGTNQPLNVMGNPIPYFPANSSDNTGATLKVHLKETLTGVVTEGETIPNGDWKFCYGTGATLSAHLHRQGSLRARRRHRGLPRCRLVLQVRVGGRFRHGEPACRQDPLGDHSRLVAVGELHAPPDPPRHERGRGRAHRARRRLAADRRAARLQQLPLGAARRRARALPDGQRRSAVVAQLSGSRAQSASRRHSRPLQPDQHVPEDHRDLRRRGSVRAEDDHLVGRHGSEERHPGA